MSSPFSIIGHQNVLAVLPRQHHSHALLLVGNHRIGRRLLARWLAASIQCTAPLPEQAPCGNCPSCRMIEQGTHPDYWEIGPKEYTSTSEKTSKRSSSSPDTDEEDEAKEPKDAKEAKTAKRKARKMIIPLRVISEKLDQPSSEYQQHVVEWLSLAPTFQRRIVVFDGAEYLNKQAANALLKTIEEPPHNALFIFITADSQQVIPTINSRCTRIVVPPVAEADMQAALQRLGNSSLHPDLLAFAAGRPGVLLEYAQVQDALTDAQHFVATLAENMLSALGAAESLEKRFDPQWHAEALGFVFRSYPAPQRVAADAALEQALAQLEHYANPHLVFQVLALKLRAILAYARP